MKVRLSGRWYYVAANKYESCGHKHRTERAAERCLPKIDPTHGRVRVWPIREAHA